MPAKLTYSIKGKILNHEEEIKVRQDISDSKFIQKGRYMIREIKNPEDFNQKLQHELSPVKLFKQDSESTFFNEVLQMINNEKSGGENSVKSTSPPISPMNSS